MNIRRQRKAFTIVEMVIVIAVIAILATVLIPTISSVIAKANISADQQFAASLTIQLAVWDADLENEIKSESDLRDAINHYYGDPDENGVPTKDFYATLEPKSGKQGYHYWYDTETKRVELAKYEDLATLGIEIADSGNVFVAFAEGEPKPFTPKDFSNASPRSIEAESGKRFFLMDQAGSDEILELAKLEKITLSDTATYGEILAKLEEYGKKDNLFKDIHTKLLQTAIANNSGIFSSVEEPSYLYIPATATQLNGTPRINGSFSVIDFKNITTVELPKGVKVGSFALIALPNTAIIETTLDENTVKAHFFDNATGKAVSIKLSNGTIVTFESLGSLGASQTIGSFKVDIPDVDGDGYVVDGNKLYIAENFTGKINLSITDILDDSDKPMYATGAKIEGVTATDVGGNAFELNVADVIKSKTTFEIAVNLLTKTEKIDVTVVEIDSVYIDYRTAQKTNLNIIADAVDVNANAGGSIVTDVEMILTLAYSDNSETWEFIPSFSQNPVGIDVDFKWQDIEVTTTIDCLEYNNGTFKIKADSTPAINEQGTITLKYGGESVTHIIRLVKKAESKGFEIDDRANTEALYYTSDVNGNKTKLVYTVGNKDAFALKYLFDLKDQNDAVLTLANNAQFYVDVLNATGTSYVSGKALAKSSLDDTLDLRGLAAGTYIIRISSDNRNESNYLDLTVNVVDAYNVVGLTSWEAITDNNSLVLLDDLKNFNYNESTPKQDGMITIKNGVVYGNLHKIYWDNNSSYSVAKQADNAIITLNNGTIENLIIDGPTYTTASSWGDAVSSGKYVVGVYVNGNSTIRNSYISGFRSPISAKTQNSTLNLMSTTLMGGAIGNIYVNQSGITLNITNCTMIRNFEGNLAGPGIYLDEKATGTTITMSGTEQYTFADENQAKKLPGVSSLGNTIAGMIVDAVNDSVGTHKINGTTYVHMGVLMHASATVNGWTNNTDYTINGETYRYTEQKIPSVGAKACVVKGDSTLTCTSTSWFHSHKDSCYSWNCDHSLTPGWGKTASEYLAYRIAQ